MSGNTPRRDSEGDSRLLSGDLSVKEAVDHSLARELAERKLPRGPNGRLYPLSINMKEMGMFGTGVGLYFKFVYWSVIVFAIITALELPVVIENATYDCRVNPQDKYVSMNCSNEVCCRSLCRPFDVPDAKCLTISFVQTSRVERPPDDGSCARLEQSGDFPFPQNLMLLFSLGNRRGRASTLQMAIDVGNSVLFIAFVLYFRRSQIVSSMEIKLRNITSADYSVYVKRLPKNTSAQELVNYFSVYGDVAHVYVSMNVSRDVHNIQRKEELLEEVREFEHWSDTKKAAPKLAKVRTALSRIDAEAHAARSYYCTGYAIVTFSSESACQRCRDDFNRQRRVCCVFPIRDPPQAKFRGATDLLVRGAPQPSDIIWENLEFGFFSRAWRMCLTGALSLFLILLSIAFIVAVNGKQHLIDLSNPWISFLYNVLTLIIILVSNVFLFIFIPIVARWEKFHQRSFLEMSVMIRLFLFQILNTLGAVIVLWGDNWSTWYAQGGYLLFNVLIGDAFLMNAIEYFRPFDVLIPRRLLGKNVQTQKKLNRLYTLPDFSLGMRYQFVMKAVFIGLAFSSTIPIVMVICTGSLLMVYWIDKYNVLRLYKKSPQYNEAQAVLVDVYLLPAAIICHCLVSGYLYTIELVCPETCFFCSVWVPQKDMNREHLTILLVMASILCLYLLLWVPFTYFHPRVNLDLERVHEVPFDCVSGLQRYGCDHVIESVDATLQSYSMRSNPLGGAEFRSGSTAIPAGAEVVGALGSSLGNSLPRRMLGTSAEDEISVSFLE